MAPLGFMLTHTCQFPRLGTKLAVFKLEPVETPHQETTRAPFVQPATCSHLSGKTDTTGMIRALLSHSLISFRQGCLEINSQENAGLIS